MALGLIPMFYYWAKRNPYFDMPTKEDRVAVLAGVRAEPLERIR